jgi:glyoxylase-like metal-dependent hydrolase (beta-lactamase superfamily II)
MTTLSQPTSSPSVVDLQRRRTVVAALGAALAGACLPAVAAWGARAAASRPGPLEATDLPRGGAVLVRGAGGNVCVLPSAQGLVVVDTGSPDAAVDLHKLVTRRFDRKPARWVFNTHWHPDHTGGNDRLRESGTEILAHENTRLWMGAHIESRWDGARYAPRPKAAWPTSTFYTTQSVDAGDEQIDCGYLLQAHTDGDIYVKLNRSNVLVTGDVFTVGTYPVPDPATLGWIGGLTTATDRLVKLCDAGTVVVPGSGPVADRAALEAQLAMLTTVRDRLYALLREGRSVEEMLEAHPTREFDATWGDPTTFIRAAFAGMTAHVRQIPGIV